MRLMWFSFESFNLLNCLFVVTINNRVIFAFREFEILKTLLKVVDLAVYEHFNLVQNLPNRFSRVSIAGKSGEANPSVNV